MFSRKARVYSPELYWVSFLYIFRCLTQNTPCGKANCIHLFSKRETIACARLLVLCLFACSRAQSCTCLRNTRCPIARSVAQQALSLGSSERQRGSGATCKRQIEAIRKRTAEADREAHRIKRHEDESFRECEAEQNVLGSFNRISMLSHSAPLGRV